MPALLQSLLDPRIGNQPQERDEHIYRAGDPGVHERERYRSEVERKRDFGFPIFANSRREKRVATFFGDDDALENIVGDCRQQQHKAVNGSRDCCELIFTHPCRSEWQERQPEKEMKIGPENPAADLLSRLEQVMVIVPIDADVNETQDVAQQYRQDRFQRRKFNRMRYLQFQHHNCDDDGKNTVTEGFQPGCFHFRTAD